ncbi:secretin N-terminal domain-containing protein [Aliivibrio fischeri]|uniref:secretin N-terminal domain-containing protein n=1 Tax=Aliivibrio fischeri TaxID=668 RepID=UPI001F42EE16|nr:secretin N-terminal domain-containing protein [Aliivibrio fischeri]MCE7534838.1 type II secretory pathway protein [Aliivibrio fischeri]MCE7557326.1 type II secretory pathway protein [Aliivibrio fischeri]
MKVFIALSLLTLSFFSNASTPVQNFETVNAPISDFVRWFSLESGQTIVLGNGVNALVSVNAVGLTRSELAPFFTAVLNAHGYVLKKENGFYTVVINEKSIEPTEPTTAKLYRLAHVRNNSVTQLIQSTLNGSLTQTNTESKQKVNNSTVDVLPTTNAIIVTGTKKQIEILDTLIKAIDRPQRQVFIESVISETEINDAQEIGVDMSYLGSAGFELVSSPIGAFDALNDSHAIYKGGDFTALVKAVYQSQNTKLLSRPNILILDRERGYITVGQNVPFLTSTETSDGGNVTQQIERKDVGVSLTVTPHIIGDDIQLSIKQESSSVSNSAIASDIITNTRTLQTSVKIKNGQTIALGGLISNEEKKSVSGIPLLMDIPWLGELFKSTSTDEVQKELKIIMKITVLN